jgi:hypothetical protein
MEFMSIEELVEEMKKIKKFSECPEDMLEEIASKLYRFGRSWLIPLNSFYLFSPRPLNKEFTELAKSIFMQTQGSGSTAERRKTHSQLSDKLVGLWTNAKMFEKGLKLFPGIRSPFLTI